MVLFWKKKDSSGDKAVKKRSKKKAPATTTKKGRKKKSSDLEVTCLNNEVGIEEKKLAKGQSTSSDQQKVEDSKYFTNVKTQTFPKDEFEFPGSYDQSQITLMVRDPYWLYTFWDIAGGKFEEIKKEIGSLFNSSKLILRVYDVTDISFTGLNAWSFFDIDVPDTRTWYINVKEANRSYCVDVGYLTPDGRFIVIARSNCVRTPSDKISDIVDEEWMTVDYEKMYALSGGFEIGRSSADLIQMMGKRLREEISSGFSSMGVSSFSKVKEMGKRNFWMVVDTELIVYGATDPQATLTVQGKPIPLREDGTFSLRFALPDGKQVIPVTGISPDKVEEITITPVVEKNTI